MFILSAPFYNLYSFHSFRIFYSFCCLFFTHWLPSFTTFSMCLYIICLFHLYSKLNIVGCQKHFQSPLQGTHSWVFLVVKAGPKREFFYILLTAIICHQEAFICHLATIRSTIWQTRDIIPTLGIFVVSHNSVQIDDNWQKNALEHWKYNHN